MPPTAKAARLLVLAKEILRVEAQLERLRREFERLSSADEEEELTLLLGTLTEKVQAVLDRHSRAMTAQEIAMIAGASLDSVRAALSKLIERDTVDRIATGLYRRKSGRLGNTAGDADD